MRIFKLEKQVALKRRLRGGFDFDLGVPGGGIPDGAQNLHFTSSWVSGFPEVMLALLQALAPFIK